MDKLKKVVLDVENVKPTKIQIVNFIGSMVALTLSIISLSAK